MTSRKIIAPLQEIYSRYKPLVSLCVTCLVLALLVRFTGIRLDDFRVLKTIPLGSLALLLAASLFFRLTLGYNFRLLMLFFRVKLTFREWFGLTAVSTMTNYLLPVKAGTLAQAAYLKKAHAFNYALFVSSLVGFYSVTFLVNAVAGLALSLIEFHANFVAGNKVILFFCVVTLVTFIPFVLLGISRRLAIRPELLKRVLKGIELFFKEKRVMTRFILSQILVIFAIGLRFLFAFWALGVHIDYLSCTIVALVTSFSIFLSITPANIGIKEFFMVASSTALGINASEAMMVAVVDRGVDILSSFAAGGAFSYLLVKKPRESSRDPI